MTPYEALGVDVAAPIEEIEVSYRLMLRRFSPQALAESDPATKADAAIRVREIHAAMAQVRKDARGGGPRMWVGDVDAASSDPRTAGTVAGADRDRGSNPAADGYRRDGFVGEGHAGEEGAGPETPEPEVELTPAARRARERDWSFDDLLEPVPCPYCDQGFHELDAFRHHLGTDHEYRLRDKRRRKARRQPTVVQILGLWRCVVAGVLTLAAIVTLVVGVGVWIPVAALIAVVLVLVSAALPRGNRHSFGQRRVRQHKAIRWF